MLKKSLTYFYIFLLFIAISTIRCYTDNAVPEKILEEEKESSSEASYVERALEHKEKLKYIDLHGNTILGLYKSSDGQKELENEILYHLSNMIKEMGFKIKYWDIDASMPKDADLKGVRAVVSWFRSASMISPEEYLDFFDMVINSGRKFIVLSNFGAYQYRNEPDKFTNTARINLALAKLGLWYMGDWSQDVSVLKIASKDPAMVEAGGLQDITESAFYYRFLKVDRQLKVYLALSRTDKNAGPSPIIVSNKNGGFALSRYIYRVNGNELTFLLDLKKFMNASLFPTNNGQRIALLADPKSAPSKMILKETGDMLERNRMDYRIITKDQFKFLVKGDFNSYSTIMLMLSSEDGLQAAIIEDYLNKAGNIISLLGGYYNFLAPLLLSKYVTVEPDNLYEGFFINTGFVMGHNLSMKDEITEWSSGSLAPEDGATVLGYDFNKSKPLVWTGKSGNGNVLVWNWDGFLGVQLIGLIVESLYYIQPVTGGSTLGIAHMFVDDWPLPMYQSKKEGFDVSYHQYYVNSWWPDIKKIMSDYKIPYSAYIIFNYNAVVKPPFIGGEFYAAGEESVEIARDLLANDIELGLHGYNHMSLTTEETEVNLEKWPGMNAMEASINEGKRTWIGLFGEATLPFTYVPPNNIMSEEGVAALHTILPSIKVMAPLRWGVEEETYSPIIPHPLLPEVYYFPRISFGYQQTDDVTNLIISGTIGPGLVSHFIHPDDVFDPYRSGGKDWDQLRTEFIAIIDFIARHYPWFEWIDMRETYHRLIANDSTLCSFEQEGPLLKIGTRTGALLRIRARAFKGIKRLTGATQIYSYPEQQNHIIKAESNSVTVEFR